MIADASLRHCHFAYAMTLRFAHSLSPPYAIFAITPFYYLIFSMPSFRHAIIDYFRQLRFRYDAMIALPSRLAR